MKKRVDPLGGLLVGEGSLTEEQLGDVLEQQRRGMPFASLCYLLGYADEYALVRMLSQQSGVPGVVLGGCIVALGSLRDVPFSIARKYEILPLYEDRQHVFVAVSDLQDPAVVNELAIIKGKSVIPHVALHLCLVRAIRDCYRLAEQGDAYWFGELASFEELNDPQGLVVSVSEVDELSASLQPAPLDVTDPNMPMPVDPEDIVGAEEIPGAGGYEDGEDEELDLAGQAPLPEPQRILVVDPDTTSRLRLGGILEHEGHKVRLAASGVEAVKLLRQDPPDLAIIEVMLPQIQGYKLCRSLKSSSRYGHIPVVLTTGAEAGELPGREMLEQYGADELLTRPIEQSELLGTVNHLLSRAEAPKPADASDASLFDQAIAQYREGQAEQAATTVRRALEIDPLSARYHFVLGNILQHLEEHYDAIDAYESTVSLRPDYFPALSRLAFLYYKQGFGKRALETWSLSLEHCPDDKQAARIRKFKQKLERELADREPAQDAE